MTLTKQPPGLPARFNIKSVGGRISELRFFIGPGYRVHFVQDGDDIIILLAGSDKDGQRATIKQAKEIAKAEGNKKAERTFEWANEVEKIHHELYSKALEAAEKGKDLPVQDIYVCPICGFTHEGEMVENCPVCHAKKEVFEKIE